MEKGKNVEIDSKSKSQEKGTTENVSVFTASITPEVEIPSSEQSDPLPTGILGVLRTVLRMRSEEANQTVLDCKSMLRDDFQARKCRVKRFPRLKSPLNGKRDLNPSGKRIDRKGLIRRLLEVPQQKSVLQRK